MKDEDLEKHLNNLDDDGFPWVLVAIALIIVVFLYVTLR